MSALRTTPHVVTIIVCILFVFGCSDSSSPTGTDPSSPNDSGENDSNNSSTQFDSKAAPGDAAQAFLDDSQYTALKIEVDYMEGFKPTSAALDSLKKSLSAHLSKSNITITAPGSIPTQERSTYSAEQIRNLEDKHRDHFTDASNDTIWAYFIVLDGEFSDENVLGIAYYNTSMAFFGKKIKEISGGVTQPSREKTEATVFRHEFGHNLGLVNNGIPTQQNHHDEANGHHCTNEQCVMYYAVETTDYFSNLFDGTIPKFETFCTNDMSAQGGK